AAALSGDARAGPRQAPPRKPRSARGSGWRRSRRGASAHDRLAPHALVDMHGADVGEGAGSREADGQGAARAGARVDAAEGDVVFAAADVPGPPDAVAAPDRQRARAEAEPRERD